MQGLEHIQEAPQWMKERMRALRKLPPPSLAEVRRQLQASAEYREQLRSKPSALKNGRH